ncbi:MAG: YciI family protein [Gemmatimonadota bacterium]|nr:YciI family protein [Gemmatimonadota bacterium]
MKYMLMMNTPSGTGDYKMNNWSPEDFKAHIAFMHGFNNELKEAGELVAAEGLSPPGEAKIVRAAGSGESVTDGAFAESKEFLAGFWIVDVDDGARAYALAARASAAPGPRGAPLNMPIEVRRIMGAPPPHE